MSLKVYRRYWHDDGITAVGVYAGAGHSPRELMRSFRAAAHGKQSLFIRSNAELRALSMSIFERTFVITRVLYWLAAGVAAIGLVSSLLAWELERAHELAILRSLGLTPGGAAVLVEGQTGFMGLVALLAAIPTGLLTALLLIEVINRRAFGWRIDVHLSWAQFGNALLLAIVAAAAAFTAAFMCLFAVGAARSAGPPDSNLEALRSGERKDGFALAIEPRRFEFPRDHGPHEEFRQEWWYVTGNLDSSRGERFGFELTFFRIGLTPPGANEAAAAAGGPRSAWRTRQVYVAHFAITDVARGQFHYAQKLSRDALGLAGAQAQPLRVWLDDWELGDAAGSWMLHAQGEGYELTLSAQPLLQPVLNGEQGLSRKSGELGAASYYYSIPRVAVRGKVVRNGDAADVQGLAWLDREWGSGSLGANQQGWDWFALQLRDGGALMFYSLRSRAGARDPHSAGTWVDPAGRVLALAADQVLIDVSGHWISPGGGRYPSRWRGRVPAVGLDLQARPVLPDQELRTNPHYWEGAVDVRGTRDGRDAAGRGYVELVGYGE